MSQDATRVVFRPPKLVITSFAVVGLPPAALAVMIPLLLNEPVLCFLFLSLPMGLFSYYFLSRMYWLRRAGVVLSEQGVEINMPVWTSAWLWKGEPVSLSWDEICCVMCERGYYAGAPVDEYIIHTARGSFTLTKSICTGADEIARLIAARKGREFEAPRPVEESRPEEISPEEDETSIRRNAFIVLATLVGFMLAIFMIMFAGTKPVLMLESLFSTIMNISNAVFILTTIAVPFGCYLKVRKRRRIERQRKAA